MLTVKAVADKLGVSDKHVYRLIESGALQAVNVSAVAGANLWRIPSESLETFQAARTSCQLEKSAVPGNGMLKFATGGKEFIESARKARQRHRRSNSKQKSAKIYSLPDPAAPTT